MLLCVKINRYIRVQQELRQEKRTEGAPLLFDEHRETIERAIEGVQQHLHKPMIAECVVTLTRRAALHSVATKVPTYRRCNNHPKTNRPELSL